MADATLSAFGQLIGTIPPIPGLLQSVMSSPLTTTPIRQLDDPKLLPSADEVDFGHIVVPADEAVTFAAAITFLSQDPAAQELILELEYGPLITNLAFVPNNGIDEFDPNTCSIYWNKNLALQTTNTSLQPPVLALYHEMDHAWQFEYSPLVYIIRSLVNVPGFDTAEEFSDITGAEQQSAMYFGYGVRFNHEGTPYLVASPFVLTPHVFTANGQAISSA